MAGVKKKDKIRIKTVAGFVCVDSIPSNWVCAIRRDDEGFYWVVKRRSRGTPRVICGSDAIPDTVCHADGRVYDRKTDLYAAIEASGCRIAERGESEAARKEAENRTGFEGVSDRRWNEILQSAKEKTEAITGETVDLE